MYCPQNLIYFGFQLKWKELLTRGVPALIIIICSIIIIRVSLNNNNNKNNNNAPINIFPMRREGGGHALEIRQPKIPAHGN